MFVSIAESGSRFHNFFLLLLASSGPFWPRVGGEMGASSPNLVSHLAELGLLYP